MDVYHYFWVWVWLVHSEYSHAPFIKGCVHECNQVIAGLLLFNSFPQNIAVWIPLEFCWLDLRLLKFKFGLCFRLGIRLSKFWTEFGTTPRIWVWLCVRVFKVWKGFGTGHEICLKLGHSVFKVWSGLVRTTGIRFHFYWILRSLHIQHDFSLRFFFIWQNVFEWLFHKWTLSHQRRMFVSKSDDFFSFSFATS